MKKLLRHSLVPLAAGLLLGGLFAVLLGRILDRAITDRTRRDLEARATAVATDLAPALLPDGADVEKVRWLARETGARVTVISADGRVVADSDVSPEKLPTLENHGGRPEILEARRTGLGFDRRPSTTVGLPFVYVARRVGPGEAPAGYVRLSVSQQELDAHEAPFRRTILDVSLGAGALVALLFLAVRRRQRRELSRVTAGIAEAAEGRAPRLPAGSSEETEEVFGALTRFARLVAAQVEGSEKARLLARTVFEQVPVGLVVVDSGLGLLDANPAALALFRVPAGSPCHALVDVVREPAILKLFETGIRAAATGAPPATETVRLDGGAGVERVLEVTVRALPHPAPAGEAAAVGVVRDVTERERTEAMRRRFVSDVSHELRTPVAAIRAAVETLAAEESLPTDLAPLLDILMRQSGQMGDLVSDLMDLSQIESGAVQLALEDVPLRRLLLGVANDLGASAAARDVTVAVEAPDALGVVGDARRLAQIFRNLIDNAIKFSPAGARVDVLAEATAGPFGERQATVQVVDRGIGIPRTELSNIFQRFYRVDPSRAKSVPGTGLGLAIVKHLLILHGGSIAVDSEPGKGSRFRVILPRTETP
ncbi:MAG TPA: ATP-binding protein [Thermoanaerobaculia bacterium]|nr:ATP-binding protein [Thermoanaerobaculia bacterium]HQR67414.1 ATP-binding protein [Thermoanaerobaculia bacterium]